MEHNITPELEAIFTRKAEGMGFAIRKESRESDPELLLTAFMGEKEVCCFERSGAMRHFRDNPLVAERKELHNLLLTMKEPFDLYLGAKPLEFVEGYRLISDFKNHLLAAKLGEDKQLHFTTWEYTYDRTGVTIGHYYDQNYQGALQDYMLRSGLVSEQERFTEEELVVLHDACAFRGRADDEISYDDEKALRAVMDKVESNIPSLIFDHEQSAEQEMEVSL